jgi:hypothetical protein
MKKLTKWQWIALIFSAVWVVVIIYSEHKSATELAESISSIGYRSCIEDQAKAQKLDLALCESEKANEHSKMMTGQTTNAIVSAFLPLPFLWLYAYLLLIFVRSLKYGYKNVVDTEKLSKPKKAFVYFCYFYIASTIFVILIAFLNYLTDQKVPVSLGYNKSLYQSDDYVVAKGTWTSKSGILGESNMIFPMQTSEIIW